MKLTSLVSAGLLLAATAASQAAVIVTLPTASTAGSMVIDAPISFVVTVTGGFSIIAFDEWVTSDTIMSGLIFAPDTTLSYTVNAGLPQTPISVLLVDNLGFSAENMTANDGYIFVATDVLLVLGDIFTLLPGTFGFPAQSVAGFNPAVAQTFTGNMFLANEAFTALSGLTPAGGAVPEPSAALLSLLGVGLLITRRRMA